MAVIEDLPTEILRMIFEGLPLSILTRLCRVSWTFQSVSMPLLYKSFKSVSGSTKPDHFRSFSETVMKNSTLGIHVKSIRIEEAEDYTWTNELRMLLLPLLSKTPNIRHLRIPEYEYCLVTLKDHLEQEKLSLPYLQDFHFSAKEYARHPTQLWGFLKPLPNLSRLFIDGCWYRQIKLAASHPSRSLQYITLTRSYLDNDSISTLIQGCQCLKGFRYLHPKASWLVDRDHFNAEQIYNILLSHRDSLEEIHVELPSYPRQSFDKTPKFGSFLEFPALAILGVDKNTLSAKPLLPPSLSTVIICQCHEGEPETLFENIISDTTLTSLSCVQVDDSFAAIECVSVALVRSRRILVRYASPLS